MLLLFSVDLNKVLKQLSLNPRHIKIIVAVYEAEVNIAAHSFGGRLSVLLSQKKWSSTYVI